MLIQPYIIETVGRSKKTFDIPSKLFEQNIVTLFGPVSEELAYTIITQLLYLDTIDTDESVKLYINSPGGDVYSGLAIHDVIKHMSRKVDTVCTGIAASMGAFLLFSGTGVRKALPNSRIMIHSVSSRTGGTVHDQIVDLEETKYLQNKLMSMQAAYSKGVTSLEELTTLTLRDKYLSPEETIQLGLLDEIVS